MNSDDDRSLPRAGSREAVPMRPASPGTMPPHPLDKRWFAHVDGQNYGPYTGHEIRKMIDKDQITDTDFLCPEGGNAWTQAQNEPLLGAMFRKRQQVQRDNTATVATANGGTIVQVTNNMPNPMAHALLLEVGDGGPKSPGIALLLSLFICGVGQMYNGQVAKGILMFIGCVALWFVLLGWIVWIWSMVDAYSTAKQMNLRYQQRLLAGMQR